MLFICTICFVENNRRGGREDGLLSSPPYPLPDNIPDLFAVLYDWFAEQDYFTKAENEQWDCNEIRYDSRLEEFTRQVTESGWKIPESILSELSKDYRNIGDLAKCVYLVLRSIDQGLKPYLPTSWDDPPGNPRRMHVGTHYDINGKYNTDEVGGYVLPRCASGFREGSIRCFKNLIRADVDRKYLRLIVNRPGIDPDILRVGIVPFLYTLEDATSEAVQHGEEFCFKVKHQVSEDSGLKGRIQSAVEELRHREVHIGVFPELALNKELLCHLREALLSLEERAKQDRPERCRHG
jgi:hypothetical protein